MRISCTVEEFGKIVRGCERGDCWKCPLKDVCNRDKGEGIEQFIVAEGVVASPEEKSEAMNKHYRPAGWPLGGYQPVEKPERSIPPVGSAGEDG